MCVHVNVKVCTYMFVWVCVGLLQFFFIICLLFHQNLSCHWFLFSYIPLWVCMYSRYVGGWVYVWVCWQVWNGSGAPNTKQNANLKLLLCMLLLLAVLNILHRHNVRVTAVPHLRRCQINHLYKKGEQWRWNGLAAVGSWHKQEEEEIFTSLEGNGRFRKRSSSA